MYKRAEYEILMGRLQEPRRFMQVVLGPRQVGKSTMIQQVVDDLRQPYLHYSADAVAKDDRTWITECWNTARRLLRVEQAPEYILIFDEIQKITEWSEVVKKEWDADTFNRVPIKVVLLGSSRLLLEKGLSDSMMGRYEEIRMAHWSYPEMRDAFGLSLDQYIYYGGYPGAAAFIDDPERWERYVTAAIIDATINKDVLLDRPVYKPELLRQTFDLSAEYSGEILSLTKMLGQLQDAGNVTTIAHYLQLLNRSGLVAPLSKFAVDQARRRQSPPKLQVYNNALKSVLRSSTFAEAARDPKAWGRIFESAVGAHILNCAFKYNFDVHYWREGSLEVDFVISKKGRIGAFEAKSAPEGITPGMRAFGERYKPSCNLVVGPAGIPVEKFFALNPLELL